MSDTRKIERINLRYFLRLETEWKGVNSQQASKVLKNGVISKKDRL